MRRIFVVALAVLGLLIATGGVANAAPATAKICNMSISQFAQKVGMSNGGVFNLNKGFCAGEGTDVYSTSEPQRIYTPAGTCTRWWTNTGRGFVVNRHGISTGVWTYVNPTTTQVGTYTVYTENSRC